MSLDIFRGVGVCIVVWLLGLAITLAVRNEKLLFTDTPLIVGLVITTFILVLVVMAALYTTSCIKKIPRRKAR